MSINYKKKSKYISEILKNLNFWSRIKFFTHDLELPDNLLIDAPVVYIYNHRDSRRVDFDLTADFVEGNIESVKVINGRERFSIWLVLINFIFLPLLPFYVPDLLVRINLWYRSRKLKSIFFSGGVCKCVVTFCDSLPVDHLIASIANEFGKITATFQHGFYYTSNNKRAENIALKYFVSRYMFCWGNSTIVEGGLIGLSPDRFLLVGKFSSSNNKNRCCERFTQNIVVHLNSRKAININVKIIKIINSICIKLGAKYSLTLHPDDSIVNYKDYLCESNYEEINMKYSSFVNVIYSSGVVYDLWSLKLPIFCYKDGESPRSFSNYFNSFSDAESFIDGLSNLSVDGYNSPFVNFSPDDLNKIFKNLSLDDVGS